MGNFLQALKQHQIPHSKLTFFRQYSLSNIQQSNGKYKYLCDTFSIDESQFIQIFGQHQEIFKMFDDDNNLLINGLELFTGLILFTDNCKFEDKIKFIFDIYDFNSQNSLYKNDVQYMFISTCSACNKILNIKDKFKQGEIIEFVNNIFTHLNKEKSKDNQQDKRERPEKKTININQMMKWAKISKQINTLFEIVEQRSKSVPEIQKIHNNKIYIVPEPNKQQIVNLGKQGKRTWLNNIIKRTKQTKQYPSQIQYSDIKLQIDHIVGFRTQDTKSSIVHISLDQKHYLLYPSACIVVISLLGSSKQQFYAKHQNQVISICNHNEIVASGELAKNSKIHIWNLKTKNTINIIEGPHRNGIHILKFIKNGEKLIVCGLGGQISPIHIYNTQNYSIQRAVSINFPIVQLAQINQYKMIDGQGPSFIVGTIHSCYLLQNPLKQLIFKPKEILTCFQMIHLNKQRKYLQYYEQNDEGIKILFTGSQDGTFTAWKVEDDQTTVLFEKKYHSQIIKIGYLKQFIVVVTFSSTVEFFNYNLQISHALDITALGVKLLSYDIIDFISFDNVILISTMGGQLLRLEQTDKKFQYKAQRITKIVNLKGQQNAAAILRSQKKQILYVGGSEGTIVGMNLSNHQIIDLWKLSENITALDVVNHNNRSYIACGTKLGIIYLRINLQQVEKSFKCRKQITDLKFVIRSNNQLSLIATAVNGKIYVFQDIMQNQLTSRYKQQIQNEISVSIHVQNQRALINTQNNNVYLMSLSDRKHRQIKQNDTHCNLNSHIFKLSYYHKQLAKMDVVCTPKIVVSASSQGGILVCRNKQAFAFSKQFSLEHHKSKVSCVMITNNLQYLITIGKYDNTIIKYKILFSQIPSLFAQQLVIQQPTIQSDDIIDRQVAYCTYTNNLMCQQRDQHLLVRGLKHPTLTTLLSSLVEKWSQNNYQQVPKNSPPLNIKLSHVYGLQSYQRRNNLICLHNPKRYLYYVSKVAVIQHPYTNQQQFYLGHRFKITSICLIDQNRVATGESASLPSVHIWNYHNMTTISVIETTFKLGIMSIISSQNHIISCGLDEKINFQDRETPLFGFSVNDIKSGTCIGTRYEGLDKIYSIASNPINPNEFCSTGNKIINFWTLKDKTIQKTSECFCEQTVTASVYYYYKVDKQKKVDLLVGTYSGNIGVIVNKNKFIKLKQKAHLKFINCIKWIQIDSQTDIFVTSSQDESIKIWNKYFQCLFEQDVRKIQDYKQILKAGTEKKSTDKIIYEHNLSIQSISYWKKQHDRNHIQLLLSTRNGEVIKFNYNTLDSKAQIDVLSRNHSSQLNDDTNKRIFFTTHPRFDIMVTIGEDQNLFIWDTQKNKIIASKFLGYVALPTCIKFNKQGDILVIGFSDGLLIFYDCKILKPNMAISQQKYLTPTLNEIQKNNKLQKKSAVLNIQFSQTGQYLAVSYDNCYSELKNGKIFVQPSYITLYNSLQANKQHKKQLFSRPNDKLYSQFRKIQCQQGKTLYQTQHNNRYGMAAYYITFLQAQGKTYLLIYYQIVDSHQVRINYLTQTKYILWDIDTQTTVVNFELLNQVIWKKLNFPNSVSCRYQLYNNNSEKQKAQRLQNSNLLKADMTAMLTLGTQKSQNEYMILGSLNGDLHLVSTYSIEFQNNIGQQFLGKTIPAHCSFINHLDLSPNEKYLFSSGLSDQAIMKWKIIHQPKVKHITKESTKFFRDQPRHNDFNTLLEQFKQRDQLHLLEFPKIITHVMTPYRVIGRRSSGLRSKVFYDQDQKVIYSVGPNILMYNKDKKNLSLIPSNIKGSIDEISCLVVNKDGRLCISASAGTHTSLMVWQINSCTLLQKIILKDIVYPIMVRISYDNKKVILYGLDQKLKSHVLFIDLQTHKILGRMKIWYADSSSIRDGGFLFNSFNKFIMCGSNHITLWEYQGNQILYENLQIKFDKQPQKYVFLCYLPIQSKFITGCHQGYIYLWSQQGKFITREAGHTQLLQNLTTNGKYILSSGRDMTLIVWNVESNRIYKDYVFDLKDYFVRQIFEVTQTDDDLYKLTSQKKYNNQQVVSMSMKGNKLLIDTQFGSIYEFYFEQARLNQISTCTEVLNLNNRNSVVGMFFTKQAKQLYYITDKGVLSIWDVQAFCCIQERHFDKDTIDMILCEDINTYFIAFESQICACQVATQKIQNVFISKSQIKAFAVGKRINQHMIAVAQKKQDICKISIYYYYYNAERASKTTQILGQRDKLQFKNNISLNFSPKGDQLYIILDGKDFAMQLLADNQKRYTSSILNQKDEPKHVTKKDPRTEKIIQMYKADKNPILDIKQIGKNNFLVGDTLGSLKLFSIEDMEKKQPKLLDYSLAHMNQISKIQVSQDQSTSASYSKVDESIIIWKINP